MDKVANVSQEFSWPENSKTAVDSRLSEPMSCVDEGAGESSLLWFERSVIPATELRVSNFV
jgi:hypothetical protein